MGMQFRCKGLLFMGQGVMPVMNHKEIESLKATLARLVGHGCKMKNDVYGVNGRVVGVGFRPFWTNPADSKIEKLEFNFVDANGRVRPFYLYNVIGYDIVSYDADRLDNSRNISFDIHVYSPNKGRDEEPYDKIRIDITVTDEKSRNGSKAW